MKNHYYQTIVNQLKERSAEATLGVLGLKSEPLRKYLKEQLTLENSKTTNILADPVFEAVFPWTEAEQSLEELSGDLLHPSLVKAMDKPPKELSEQAFKKEWSPYTHQLKAWKILSEQRPKSLIVTSGTGSGKTECFMVPILNDLANQQAQTKRKLEGVQALFIYPLNALINSQRDRLSAWTNAYGDKVRFSLYNGNTPRRIQAAEKNQSPNEVLSREDLWTSPPPILITNPTMLEYMLIRNEDKSIIEQSKGKLKYIVLDEAHTYIGSQAAELSLLIRRALHAFNVKPEDVRFIATSATIGTDELAKEALKKYLADLAGIDIDRIEIIDGKRNVVELPEINQSFDGSPVDILAMQDIQVRKEMLLSSPIARRLRDGLKNKPRTLHELTGLLFPNISVGPAHLELTLKWLDLCSNPEITEAKENFLPLRGHFFHRVLHGLFSCVDPECAAKEGTKLKDQSWKFGKVYTQQRIKCECGAPVYEIVFCNECNTTHLQAYQSGDKIVQAMREQVDEFSLDIEENYEEDGGAEENEVVRNGIIIAPEEGEHTLQLRINQEGVKDGMDGDGILIHIDDHDLACSNCNFKGQGNASAFRHAYLGTPFYISTIVPTLLEHCPDGKQEPLSRPMRGRSLITFTDSRQGTARIAAKMQQDAERIRTRGLVYNAISEKDNTQEINALTTQIKALEPSARNQPALEELLRQLQNNLQELKGAAISWGKLVRQLQDKDDIYMHMLDYYRDLNPVLFSNSAILTKILLIREFSRRPRRANSPETLGLVAVSYQGLDKINKAPNEWTQQGFSLADWKDFLKISLDFYVRDGIFVDIPRDWLNWLGGRFTPKYLLSPDSEEQQDARHKKWPQFDNSRGVRQQRLIRLLAHAFDFKLEAITREEIDILNILMLQAWDDLTNASKAKVLSIKETEMYQLGLEKLQFKSISQAWYCPVTLRALDTTLRGYTPYLPVGAKPKGYQCEVIKFPTKPTLTVQGRRQEVRKWIAESDEIQELRDKGLWTDQSDRIAEGGFYFRSAEHSAQQPSYRLKKYEKRFKEGRLNVLSCSTTMEMGVDIGGLSMVCNNNVPPHPANYLQRAGRAGRRNEARSLSLTICKDNPHDQAVFRNPLWAFTTQLKQPNITLSSERIVQRHINALLLGYELNERLQGLQNNAIRLQCGWFFSKEENTLSICERMILWLDEIESSKLDSNLRAGLNSIKARSILEGHTISQLTSNSADTLRKINEKWIEEYELLQDEINAAAGVDENDPYKRRIQRDIDRHEMEYLLSELVAGGFLPGYGFPTGIASFNHYNVSDYERQRRGIEEREDNRQRYKEKPSRNLAMALREYAPGADVVLDGLVYKSEGLSLNWHIPDDGAGVVENQKLRQAWRCGNCGSSGTASSAFKDQCTNCGHYINPQNNRDKKIKFIQPAGFSTGFYSSPSNDISTQVFIPSEEPWIDAGGSLKPLPNVTLGYYKSHTEGNIFYHSSGEFGTGYALCLGCGKAESMKQDGTDPKMVNGHFKLWGKINGEVNSNCDAGSNKIQRNIHLGYEDRTDVFELYLKHHHTNEFLYADGTQREDNLSLCWTLAVALRYGLASSLGINTEELGISVKPTRIEREARAVYAICIYDNSGGGAGFSSSAPQYLNDLFSLAAEYLDCKVNCEDACEHCLMQHDTRKVAQYLDRKTGLEFLNKDFLNSIKLPEEDMLLGEETAFCTESFFTELDLAAKRISGELLIYLSGPTHEWNIAGSSLKRRMPAYLSTFKKLKIFIADNDYKSLTDDQKQDLFGLVKMSDSCELHLVDHYPSIQKGAVLARIQSENQHLTFASKAAQASLLNENWGNTDEHLLVKSSVFDIQVPSSVIPKNDLLPRIFFFNKPIFKNRSPSLIIVIRMVFIRFKGDYFKLGASIFISIVTKQGSKHP